MGEQVNGGDTERYGLKGKPLWASRTARVLSPITGGLLGSVYASVVLGGTFQGLYWYWLRQSPTESFTPSPVVMLLGLAVGALLGGCVAGLFVEAARPVAVVLVSAPFLIGFLVHIIATGRQIESGRVGIVILILLVSSGVGMLAGKRLQPAVNKPSSPAGIWWPHWLYFPIVAFDFPVYTIATLTNVWVDFRLGLRFAFDPRMWFWWKTWVYTFFFSWFVAIPTIMLFLGYARFLDRMQVDSGVGPQGKFKAFFLYFLTVPILALFLTFAWRSAAASLFKAL